MLLPEIMPNTAPSAICWANMGTRARGEVLGIRMRPIRLVVRKMAMGSLLPDSNSRRGLR